MKACRILILDSSEREFTPEPIVAALSAANANLHMQSLREKLGLRTLIGESECFISEVSWAQPSLRW